MRSPWKISAAEWRTCGPILATQATVIGRGRPVSADDRAAAQACLYRFFRSDAPSYRAFGWNQLPRKMSVSPATANRRFRKWIANGAWNTFWSALMKHRERWVRPRSVQSPMLQIIEELQRAYSHFNAQLFANILPVKVLILVERMRYNVYGLFRPTSPPEIALSLRVCTLGAGRAMQTLLHEMVHLRNHTVGIPDAHQGYHNLHFRDAARLFGLNCELMGNYGFAKTEFGARGAQAFKTLRSPQRLFKSLKIGSLRQNVEEPSF